MPTTTILLARHGETDWNRQRRVQGHADEPLNEAGRAQARELAAALAHETFDAIYASDLSRAQETARIFAARHDQAVTLLPELREKDFGSWEGLTDTEILQRFPQAEPGHWGDGEATGEMARRVVAAVGRIGGAHPGGRVLVVTHGGPLRALLRHCHADREGPIENCEVIRVTVDRGRIAHVG